MHALPIGLPALLPGMVAIEAARLKLQLNAGVSDQLRESLSQNKVTCYARLRLDARGAFKSLTTSLGRCSSEDFEVTVRWRTFGSLQFSLEEQVTQEWLQRAVIRRLNWGRELAHLDDAALQALRTRCRPRLGSPCLSTEHLQEAFLGLLTRAEIDERERDGSKHRTLQAIKQAKPLRDLLDVERADAERTDAPHFDIDGRNHYGTATEAPEETQRIYRYRAYHAEQREGFPLFDIFGEPWPKRGRRKRTAAADEEFAKA